MRTNILHIGAGELTYEIRNIVNVGNKLQSLGLQVNWENIGDPVAKGEKIPSWMKEIVADAVLDDATYGYSPTKGVLETRQFIAAETNAMGGVQIDPEDIIFFNGLGDAISKIFGFLKRTARVIVPTPSYTTHSSAEAAHAGDRPVTYILDPNHSWYPDLEDIENHVKFNPAVAGILIINPDNPTGAVYPEQILRDIVEIAAKNDLFIICDEVYQNMVYNGTKSVPLATVIGDKVPAISMRGVSKEMPWPGSRCGWIEVFNGHRDPMFECMAVRELKSYLEYGNITHSVNFPNVENIPTVWVHSRLIMINHDKPGMIGLVTNILGKHDINIMSYTNESNRTVGYNIIDCEGPVPQEVLKEIEAKDGVIRTRVIAFK